MFMFRYQYLGRRSISRSRSRSREFHDTGIISIYILIVNIVFMYRMYIDIRARNITNNNGRKGMY